jgi:methionyl aminopeptidase
MIYYKTKEEIELLRASCLLVCKAHELVASMLKPGVTGKQIDKAAEELIRDHGAKPGFKGYRGFPATLCISPNEGVVHGIPTDVEFKEGDIISVDCGTLMDGFYGDSAYTYALEGSTPEQLELLSITNESLYKGIDQAVAGNRIGDIGYAIQQYTEKVHGYGVVRELVGHGVGKNLHEPPEVPNYGSRGRGVKLKEGLVIAIEPMINLGTKSVRQSDDGWTIITRDKKTSAHFEHTIAVGKEKADILSNHDGITEEIKNNPHLMEISLKR